MFGEEDSRRNRTGKAESTVDRSIRHFCMDERVSGVVGMLRRARREERAEGGVGRRDGCVGA